ncbi:unnamed protein product [Sphagnum jensenii]|uniref:Integrase zinc-binding domain-containing protein n=1 Tax=Sphagnum jensenii TaxID=128206 RepID=A0ABP0V7X4_9BRYO
MVFDAYGRRGRWIDMLQDFSFKILHRLGMKHTNVDALSQNLVGVATDDDDFSREIQDIGTKPGGSIEATGGIFSVRCGRESEWLGLRRQSGGLKQHHGCCFGINHWRWSEGHQLFMLDVLIEISQEEEDDSPEEGAEARVEKEVRNSWSSKTKRVQKERKTIYYDRKQQLELVLTAQELLGDDGHETGDVRPADDEACAEDTSKNDIWEDEVCLRLLREGIIPDTVDPQTSKRARRRVIHYCWKNEKLYFKGLYVPKPEDRLKLVSQMHEELGHFGEQRTLAEIYRRADNYLDALTNEIDDTSSIEDTTVQFLEKVQLIASIHECVLLNVEQTHKKQKNMKMTTQLMEWSGAALMSGGGKVGSEESEEKEACARSQGMKKKEEGE